MLEAGWSSQALDMVERSRPDMVLAGETELCARLREGEPGRRWDRNIPVIVNIHNVELARRFADRVIGMSNGVIVFDDAPRALDHAILSRIYGGEGWLE